MGEDQFLAIILIFSPEKLKCRILFKWFYVSRDNLFYNNLWHIDYLKLKYMSFI